MRACVEVWSWSWHKTILVWTSSFTSDIPNNANKHWAHMDQTWYQHKCGWNMLNFPSQVVLIHLILAGWMMAAQKTTLTTQYNCMFCLDQGLWKVNDLSSTNRVAWYTPKPETLQNCRGKWLILAGNQHYYCRGFLKAFPYENPWEMTESPYPNRRCAALANSPLAGFTFFTVFDCGPRRDAEQDFWRLIHVDTFDNWYPSLHSKVNTQFEYSKIGDI